MTTMSENKRCDLCWAKYTTDPEATDPKPITEFADENLGTVPVFMGLRIGHITSNDLCPDCERKFDILLGQRWGERENNE
jgi:hypothetical protein